ncbi:hypothetical protein [Halorubrum tibetense]|uniref:Uncharacterized protein n=1 Tax=Halorubrum tibetense TaxID=175631 RepID=A0ABD5S8Z7_9EURY
MSPPDEPKNTSGTEPASDRTADYTRFDRTSFVFFAAVVLTVVLLVLAWLNVLAASGFDDLGGGLAYLVLATFGNTVLILIVASKR